MHYEQNRKTNLTNSIRQQVIIYKHIIEGLKAFKEHLPAFNGKVVNVRILKAFEYPNPHKLSFSIDTSEIKVSDWQHRSYKHTNGHTGYVQYHSKSCIVILQDNNRLDAALTISNINAGIKFLEESIVAYEMDIELYDEELQAWKELEKVVEQYRNKYSPRLRGTIDMNRRYI